MQTATCTFILVMEKECDRMLDPDVVFASQNDKVVNVIPTASPCLWAVRLVLVLCWIRWQCK